MTSQPSVPCELSDRDLLAEVDRAVAYERQATARLIALLMEVDSRKLYAGQGYSSLFTYCVKKLHLSEHAAYLRIEAARTARRYPAVLDKLGDGSLHLTAVSLLAPHLTPANHVGLLDSAKCRSKRDIELVVAQLRPQADAPSLIRKLPAPVSSVIAATPAVETPMKVGPLPVVCPAVAHASAPTPTRPSVIGPLTPERFKVQFTVGRETYEKLRRVQDWMRHSIPDGDPAAIFDRALTLLLEDLAKTKFAAANRPRAGREATRGSRHIPAAIRREVWRRDGGTCGFVGEQGRCHETGFLEFHHVVPFADGGETTATNLELRCRAHNQYEAEQWFGARPAPLVREMRPAFG
jgi:HNH endonuclease